MRAHLLATSIAAGLLLPTAAGSPQDGEAPPASAAQDQFDALNAEFDAAYEAWRTDIMAKMKEARAKGEELPESALITPAGDFLPKYKTGAKQHAGTEGAVPYLIWIVQQGGREDEASMKAALTTLTTDHVESPGLEPLSGMLRWLPQMMGDEDPTAMLSRLESKSVVPAIRQWAAYARCSAELESARHGTPAFDKAKDALTAAAEAIGEPGLANEVASTIRVLEKFANGMVAPEIAGIDLDGTEFKLSDYQGKVVFLDFWGDW